MASNCTVYGDGARFFAYYFFHHSRLETHYARNKYIGVAVLSTGGVFPHLPHHLDIASEDSVGHSTCMSVLTLTLTLTLTQTALSRCCYGRWGTVESPTHSPGRGCVYCDQHVAAPRQDRLGCTIDPMIALRRANTLMHVL